MNIHLGRWGCVPHRRQISSMAFLPSWVTATGECPDLAPERDLLLGLKKGKVRPSFYFDAFDKLMTERQNRLIPGVLSFWDLKTGRRLLVETGDALLCACAERPPSPELFGATPTCHLQVAAKHLQRAGWNVWLYGAPYADQ